MGLLERLTRPARGLWLLRRVLVELRAQRRGIERIADALELQAGAGATAQPPRSTFRSFSRTKGDLSERDLKGLTEVSYVDEKLLSEMLQTEDELRVILGRDPSEVEVERAYRGHST